MSEVLAGIRDAQWVGWPTRAGVKIHVAIADPENSKFLIGACSKMVWINDKFDLYHAKFVRPEDRCQRSGCKKLWPKYESRGELGLGRVWGRGRDRP